MKRKPFRIGNAQAFWGDRSDAAADMLAREPDLDFLTLDYLAEVSMSILAVQRERDATLGYARDFVDFVRSLTPYWQSGGRCRVIANAGGLNPRGCADAVAIVLNDHGCHGMKIAIVSGDDVLDQVHASPSPPQSTHEVPSEGERGGEGRGEGPTHGLTLHLTPTADEFKNLDTSAPISDIHERLVTANAYLGAAPIAEALNQGADIVITGRAADPSLVVGACLHHFRWKADDWNRLAGATIAGHLIECGTQVTGGISTDWLDLAAVNGIGFPIVEIDSDGGCIVTKPLGTGGCVSEQTVKEQLVYEIGDPGRYLSPDVTVSFLSLQVEDLGNDRVRVSGAVGSPKPETLKVSATYRDGYRAAGMLTIVGRDAAEKAKRSGEIVIRRLLEAGHVLKNHIIECLGTGACWPTMVKADPSQSMETVLRIAVESDDRAAVERFTRELMPLITAGPPGTTGYAEGRPKVHPVFRYWPCLIDSSRITSTIEMLAVPGTRSAATPSVARTSQPSTASATPSAITTDEASKSTAQRRTLRDICYARSGDKGTSANVGVIARTPEDFAFLETWLTPARVASYFGPCHVDTVERHELPNLHAFNFILRGILRNSLKTDSQGKTLGQVLLEMPLESGVVAFVNA